MCDGQFDFEGRTYKSLSVIAREITGTRWSGPLFFGLRKMNYEKKKNCVTWATTDGEGSKTIDELIFSPVYLRCSLVHHERFGRQA
jgi:hypothetical protein